MLHAPELWVLSAAAILLKQSQLLKASLADITRKHPVHIDNSGLKWSYHALVIEASSHHFLFSLTSSTPEQFHMLKAMLSSLGMTMSVCSYMKGVHFHLKSGFTDLHHLSEDVSICKAFKACRSGMRFRWKAEGKSKEELQANWLDIGSLQLSFGGP